MHGLMRIDYSTRLEILEDRPAMAQSVYLLSMDNGHRASSPCRAFQLRVFCERDW